MKQTLMINKVLLSFKKNTSSQINLIKQQPSKLMENQADRTNWIKNKSDLGLNKKMKSIFQDMLAFKKILKLMIKIKFTKAMTTR